MPMIFARRISCAPLTVLHLCKPVLHSQGDPLSGTDFFRYVQSPHVTYEGGYDTYTPPPDPALAPVVEVETKKDKKGKKDDKAAKVPKGSKAVDEEPPVSTEPARLVKQVGDYSWQIMANWTGKSA